MSLPLARRARTDPSTEEQLLDAARLELQESGEPQFTVRRVARRAGISPATAYKVFASREHLLAGVFLRSLQDLPPVDGDDERPVDARLRSLLEQAVERIAAHRELHDAVRTVVLGGGDPDARRIFDLITATFQERLATVLRDDLDVEALRALHLSVVGAFVLAGADQLPWDAVPDQVLAVVAAARGRRPDRDPAGPVPLTP